MHFGRRVASAALALAVAHGLAGCGLTPRLGTPPLAGPPRGLMREAPADSAEIPDPFEAEPIAVTSPRSKPPGVTSPKAPAVSDRVPATLGDSTHAPPAHAAAAPSDTAREATPPPALSVDLPEAERARLETKALQDLDACETIIKRVSKVVLSPESDEKLRTVRGLLQQAYAALERRDLSAAANLAYKARLLAMEIQPLGS